MHALVGTCGFCEAQDRIFRDFGILEVQRTFYQPPGVSTAARWRQRAPERFVFTLKAWQLITHEASSPTYRRLKEGLSEQALARAGSFRWNATTRMAWDRTREIAEALRAEAIVFQTPRRFVPTGQNIRRLSRFFEAIERNGRRMVFEPRGEAWSDDIVRALVRDLDLIHGVDPFLRKPVGRGLRYFRLHGRPAYHYRYRYADADLRALQGMLSRIWPNRVLFNNDSMASDARRFLRQMEPAR
ncbi:MAG: DUF72 domain-containing protein [Gammaproteobacteria bacterium]|nr:DUF72 domain-containing protein [Gammaproteobacteria bacterium]NIT64433.1 DUF72 domain-containing protein [Gammaproteobacteria bacterium]NIY33013.1 DUF72 domain-containing protein [Gammaproteobacteria bacterium]